MTEPATTEPAAATTAPTTTTTEPSDKTVPYERFAQVNQQAKDARQQLEEMTARIQELEDRDKSELERERSKREQLEKQAGDAMQRLTLMERSQWIRSAAADAGFDDPDDAVAFIAASGIESAEQAEKEVKKLAKRKPKLLKDTSPGSPIGQVLASGQRVDPNAQQRDENAEAFASQLRAAQESDGWQSIPLNS